MIFALQILLTVVATVIAVEVAMIAARKTDVFARMKAGVAATSHAKDILASDDMDDDEKQKIMKKMSGDMMKIVGAVVVFLGALFAPFFVLYGLQLTVLPHVNFFSDLALVAMTVIGVVYVYFFKRFHG